MAACSQVGTARTFLDRMWWAPLTGTWARPCSLRSVWPWPWEMLSEWHRPWTALSSLLSPPSNASSSTTPKRHVKSLREITKGLQRLHCKICWMGQKRLEKFTNDLWTTTLTSYRCHLLDIKHVHVYVPNLMVITKMVFVGILLDIISSWKQIQGIYHNRP